MTGRVLRLDHVAFAHADTDLRMIVINLQVKSGPAFYKAPGSSLVAVMVSSTLTFELENLLQYCSLTLYSGVCSTTVAMHFLYHVILRSSSSRHLLPVPVIHMASTWIRLSYRQDVDVATCLFVLGMNPSKNN